MKQSPGRGDGATYQSPPTATRPSGRPVLGSRFAFWPAAAEAKLEGRLVGILGVTFVGPDGSSKRGLPRLLWRLVALEGRNGTGEATSMAMYKKKGKYNAC